MVLGTRGGSQAWEAVYELKVLSGQLRRQGTLVILPGAS